MKMQKIAGLTLVTLGLLAGFSAGASTPTPPSNLIYVDTCYSDYKTNTLSYATDNTYPRTWEHSRVYWTDDAVNGNKEYLKTFTSGPAYHQMTSWRDKWIDPSSTGTEQYVSKDTSTGISTTNNSTIYSIDCNPSMTQGTITGTLYAANTYDNITVQGASSATFKYWGGTPNYAYKFWIFLKCHLWTFDSSGLHISSDVPASGIQVNGTTLSSSSGVPYYEVNVWATYPQSPAFINVTPTVSGAGYYSFEFVVTQYKGATPLVQPIIDPEQALEEIIKILDE